jgi:peptidoglycan/LPS O-acetylase OafA/YrhL
VSRDPEARPKRRMGAVLGALAFFVGMFIAVICGAVPDWRDSGVVVLILVILGIIVGAFNITGKEIIPFLIAAIALVVVGIAGGSFSALDDIIDGLGRALDAIVGLIAVFMVPAAVINAVRVVVELARPGEAG